MDSGSAIVLLALTLFAIKHFVADFLLQTDWMNKGKGVYGHAGGFAHVGVHILGSLPALMILAPVPEVIALLLLAEGVAHYHIDWAKQALTRRFGTDPDHRSYWILIGADQFLHQLTYLTMTAIALAARA